MGSSLLNIFSPRAVCAVFIAIIFFFIGSEYGDRPTTKSAAVTLEATDINSNHSSVSFSPPPLQEDCAEVLENTEEASENGIHAAKNDPLREGLSSIKIGLIPSPVINSYLKKHISSNILSKVDDNRKFAEGIVNILTAEDDSKEVTEGELSTYASYSPVQGMRPLDSPARFNQYDSVYIHFVQNYSKELDILLKWKSVSTGKILRLDQASLDPEESESFRYFRPSEGWNNDTYRLFVYNMHGENELLSELTFQVDTVYSQDPTELLRPNTLAIEEMLSVGRASAKLIPQ